MSSESVAVEKEQDDERWMRRALAEAERAVRHGDVPIGAVVVRQGEVLGRGR
ncbi:MAG TPA: deaminase, partial [Thermoanaerobaculia bacterium]